MALPTPSPKDGQWIVATQGGIVGSTALVRALNERSLLDRIRSDGPASRVDLARVTGLSKPTVSSALANLVAYGLVEEAGAATGKPGPAAIIYRANSIAGTVMSLDIGRSWIRLAIADLSGSVLVRSDVPNKAKSSSALKQRVESLVLSALDHHNMKSVPRPAITVLGGPGIPDPETASMRVAGILPGWGKVGFLDELKSVLVGDVIVENDTNLAAIGEHSRGAGRGLTDFVLVSIGTGIGCGIVINGQLHRGSTGAAGELGFLPMGDPVAELVARPNPLHGGDKAPRASIGSFERICAADGIVRAAQVAGLDQVITARDIFELAGAGNQRAIKVLNSIAELLGRALTTLVVLLDPQLILITGGVGENIELLLPVVNETIKSFAPIVPPVKRGPLGVEAALYGGITLALPLARENVFVKVSQT